MRHLLWLLLWLPLLLAGCQEEEPFGPEKSVVTGDERTVYYFQANDAADWDVFTTEDEAATFRLAEGTLEGGVLPGRGYIWSLDGAAYDDVLVRATLRQTEGAFGSAYGLICRADERGNGYYFLIASTGEFSIQVGTDDRNDLFQLVPWQRHQAINRGYVANEVRVVCVEDYLAFFINDVFMADTTDDEFTSGQLGVTLGAVEETAWARFDDILIQNAFVVGER